MTPDEAVLVDAIERVVTIALTPIVARLRALEIAFADVGPLRARIAALEALFSKDRTSIKL